MEEEVNVLNLGEIKQVFGDKTLADKEFTLSKFADVQVEKPVELDAVSFAFSASGTFQTQLFNSPDDQDDDRLIGSQPDATIQPLTSEAWLKHQVRSDLKASAGLELSAFGFDINGEKSLIFKSYKVHDNPTATLQKAFTQDFTPFLFLAKRSHLKQLKPREVLAVHLPGKLNTALTLSWSDLFTGSLSAFSNLLTTDQVLSLELGPKLDVRFSVDIQDDFSLIIRKNTTGTYELFLKKTQSKQLAGKLAATIDVGFSDSDAVKKVLGDVTEGLLSPLKGKIQPILQKNPLAKLSDSEKAIVAQVGGALGFSADLIATVADFETVLDEKVGSVIKTVATARMKFGFAYEYNRVSSTDVFLRAELSETALDQYHSGLIRFKLEEFTDIRGNRHRGLLTDYRLAEAAQTQPEGVVLKDYLKEQTTKRSQSWGFSLGINKWVLKGTDHVQLKEVIRENGRNNRQVAFVGTRGYDGNFFGSKHNWKVDFNAEMDQFSQLSMPLVNELKYGLYLLMEWEKGQPFNNETIRDIVDQAVLWNVLGPNQFDAVVEQLSDLFGSEDVTNGSASIHLKISADAFHPMLNNISFLIQHKPDTNASLMARSLGASMSYVSGFPIRQTVDMRSEVYGPLWALCLSSENQGIIEQDERINLAFAAQDRLKKFGEHTLATKEADSKIRNEPNGLFFSGTLAMNPRTRSDWHVFNSGLLELQRGFSQGLIYEEVVKKAFQRLQRFWTQGHYVRALGHYLLTFANNEVLAEGVDKSLTITYEKAGETKTLNLLGKVN